MLSGAEEWGCKMEKQYESVNPVLNRFRPTGDNTGIEPLDLAIQRERFWCLSSVRGWIDAVYHHPVSGGDVGLLESSVFGGAVLE